MASCSEQVEPPETASRTPVAPWISWPIERRRDGARAPPRGARFGPLAMPMPISAEPASFMIVRTSAKSRLIRPGVVIRSQMPCTPWRSRSSATRKASTIDVFWSSTCSRRSFGIVTSVSTLCCSSRMPRSAWLAAARALEAERRRDDADGQRAELARDARHDGRGAGAGAAALAGGDEDEVRAAQRLADAVVGVLGGAAADLRVGARAEARGELLADLDRDVGVGAARAAARRC